MCLMVLRVREIGQHGQGKEIEDTNSKLLSAYSKDRCVPILRAPSYSNRFIFQRLLSSGA